MNTHNMGWLGLAMCGALACCGKDPSRLPGVGGSPTLAVDNGLLFLDDTEPQVYLLDLTRKVAAVDHIDVPRGVKTALARPGQDPGQVVLLTAGLAASKAAGEHQPQVEAHLVVLSAAGEQARYPLGSRFGALALAPDGHFAVAYAPEAGFSFGTSIAVVDLTTPPRAGHNPRLINVTSLDGQVPARFVFSPEVNAAGEPRRLLATLVSNYINLIDLGHIERGEITIPLTLPGSGLSLDPHEILFAGDRIYVQSRGATDVLVVQLTETTLAVNPHGFETSLLSLPVGHALRGAALVGAADAPRLLALSDAGAHMIDPRTGKGTDVALAGDYDAALLFEARSPGDDARRQRALLYGTDARIAFLDLDATGVAAAASAEEMVLPEGVRQALPLLDRKLLVLTHDGDRISVVDLERRTVAPLSLGAKVQSTVLDSVRARLWITTVDGGLGTLDLATLVPAQILLDADATELVLVPGSQAQMAVIHRSDAGFVTLLEADQPSRPAGRALLGFLWNGVLQ